MELGEIFKNSFNYAVSDWPKLLILGVLLVVANISSLFIGFGVNVMSNLAVNILLSIISIVCYLVIGGFGLSIIRDTLSNSDSLPEFDIAYNFIDGVKVLILGIVYFIIPFIVVWILFIATGGASALGTALSSGNITAVPSSVAADFTVSLFITIIVGIILFVFFSLLSSIGQARLAKTGSLGDAVNFVTSFKEASEIGWGKYFIWFIILAIISFIFIIIGILIGVIPIVGIIIDYLVLTSILTILQSRALGLIYSDI